MRQLRLSKASPAVAAELAEALCILQTLPVPPNLPPSLAEAFAPAALQLIVSIAAQYQGRGVNLIELARAGFVAVANAAQADDVRAIARGSGAWWAREGMLTALANVGQRTHP